MAIIKGWKKLTKPERQHLFSEGGIRSTEDFKKTIDWQRAHPRWNGTPACLVCERIAQKLGM